MKRIIKFLQTVFSTLLSICMILGFMVAIAFFVAILIGGSAAVIICAVNAKILPVIYVTGTLAAFIGIIKMYFCKEYEFVMKR